MPREISQKQTDKYHMNPLLWGIEKSQAHGIKNRIVVARNWGRVAWSTRVLLINRHFQMKISTAKPINKKCHSHQRFLASKCECGLPKLNPADAATRHGDPLAMVIHPPWWSTRHGDCWGAGGAQGAAICHSCHCLRWTRRQDLAQIAEVHMKTMNSVSPEAWIFPYRQC